MGCSNPHPHCQVSPFRALFLCSILSVGADLGDIILAKCGCYQGELLCSCSNHLLLIATFPQERTQKQYFAEHGRPMLLDYIQIELEDRVSIAPASTESPFSQWCHCSHASSPRMSTGLSLSPSGMLYLLKCCVYVCPRLSCLPQPIYEPAHLFDSHLLCFRALWPYETMLLPKRHVRRISDITGEEKTCSSIAKCSGPWQLMSLQLLPTS